MKVGDPAIVERPSWRGLGVGVVWRLSRRMAWVTWLVPRFPGDAGGVFPRRDVHHNWQDPADL